MPDSRTDAREQRWTLSGVVPEFDGPHDEDVLVEGPEVGLGESVEVVPAARLAEVERELATLRADSDLGVREIRCQVARAERAEVALDRAREALEFYADESNFDITEDPVEHRDVPSAVDFDGGRLARAVLAASSSTTTTEDRDG